MDKRTLIPFKKNKQMRDALANALEPWERNILCGMSDNDQNRFIVIDYGDDPREDEFLIGDSIDKFRNWLHPKEN